MIFCVCSPRMQCALWILIFRGLGHECTSMDIKMMPEHPSLWAKGHVGHIPFVCIDPELVTDHLRLHEDLSLDDVLTSFLSLLLDADVVCVSVFHCSCNIRIFFILSGQYEQDQSRPVQLPYGSCSDSLVAFQWRPCMSCKPHMCLPIVHPRPKRKPTTTTCASSSSGRINNNFKVDWQCPLHPYHDCSHY